VDRSIDLDVPRIMRGTVASEAIIDGYQPVIVRGYGLVVGLNGTGSRDIPPQVRAHMLAEMARHGIGSERTGWGDLKPEAMLDSPDAAVVIMVDCSGSMDYPPTKMTGAREATAAGARPSRTAPATTRILGGLAGGLTVLEHQPNDRT
jgi:hypothetical protein